jgi:SRSO17 transposase
MFARRQIQTLKDLKSCECFSSLSVVAVHHETGRLAQHGRSGAEGRQQIQCLIDDTSLPKKGAHSAGVAPQYASMLGKRANCQTLVSLTLARDEVPIAVGLRLFLPESWTSDPLRMTRAGVPEQFRRPRSKPEMALDEIDRLMAAGMRFGAVLADAGYGLSTAFRQALSARGLMWAVGIPKHQKVYPADVSLTFPVAGRGRPRKNPIPDTLSAAAGTVMSKAAWRKLSWRRGTKGLLAARFAALRIRIADGHPPTHPRQRSAAHAGRSGVADRRMALVG